MGFGCVRLRSVRAATRSVCSMENVAYRELELSYTEVLPLLIAITAVSMSRDIVQSMETFFQSRMQK